MLIVHYKVLQPAQLSSVIPGALPLPLPTKHPVPPQNIGCQHSVAFLWWTPTMLLNPELFMTKP